MQTHGSPLSGQNQNVELNGERQDFSQFVVDESHLVIEGKEHVLLACLGFEKPLEIAAHVLDAKFEISLDLGYEIKWGKRDLSEADRQTFTERLFELIGGAQCAIVVLHEGRDKQGAAEALVHRIVRHCEEAKIGAFSIVFDRSLVRDAKLLWRICLNSESFCLGLQEHESEYDQVLQLADLFAGFFSYAIRQTLNEGPSGKIALWIDGDQEVEGFELDLPLNDWFFIEAMSLLPLSVSESVDEEGTWVDKGALGSGFLIQSSMSSAAQSALHGKLSRHDLKS